MSMASVALLLSEASAGGGGGTTDPNFASVKLLMGFEGPNGSITTGFADESSAAHGTLVNGNATFACCSTTQAKFGSASLRTNGTGVWLPDSADWDLGSAPFTIEMSVRADTAANGTFQFLIGQWLSAGNLGWILNINSAGHLAWNVSTTGSDNLTDITASGALSNNTWYDACIEFDSSKYRLYQDGLMVGSSTTPRTIFNSGNNLSITTNSNDSGFRFTGYTDEIRITKGVARYASDSGYTVPTAAFPRS